MAAPDPLRDALHHIAEARRELTAFQHVAALREIEAARRAVEEAQRDLNRRGSRP